ncbi:adenosine deaminase family protein [Janthinobacterium fluminis]|uniref:adenosine deaminase n=1 Tax=Janthinobacterium fluminis TaxID=2987524 RepID=A0ABT5K041_9BURK|nr:adenosine deaminase [Janthinobacterium fluminis]MDC8757122.1 adenosine deaminase [Janthinobacterium fluminis]
MQKKFPCLMIALALAGGAHAATAASNEEVTKRHFAALVSGAQPKMAELTMFFSMMPKGGDLHHHYSGAIYAEQYLEWVDKQHYCVDKATYQIVSVPAAIAAGRAKGTCLSSAEVIADNAMYRELLQRWSIKDFSNHGALQSPPDRQFFDTFGYFGPVASTNTNEGLLTLKQRAIKENLAYIETIFELAPFTQDADFDQKVAQPGTDLGAQMAALSATLERDAGFQQNIANYLANVKTSSAGVDDAQFSMRYQAYVLRFLSPSQVFSSMLAGFKLASQSPQVVGVNIVGAENFHVSMRDYALHMQMFKFLKAKYPSVKLALHAGELALGMVPPEGLSFHISDAIEVAGADRIGHGIDLAHETKALAILQTMRERGIPVEINLTSNEFIAGVKNAAHPLDLYRRHGVPLVISTDDPGVSRNNLSGEYVLFASRYKTDYAEVKKLSYNSLRYSFLADADKQRLIKQLDGRFAAFEAAIAAAHKKTTAPKP